MLLEFQAIEKRYGGVTALRSANLSVAAGEVHLLLGENGAGKSTLMKIAAGLVRPDGGTMRWKGAPVHLNSPADAARIGVAMVHQESLLAPRLSVAENILLGREERRPFGWVRRRKAVEQAARLIEQHRFPLQADWLVEKLSPAGKQLVEICRAIHHGSSLLIFDEPTSSLSSTETEEVFRIVRTLRERQMGVIYITHRLEELRAIGDRVTILRDGAAVYSGELSSVSTPQIISHMVGRTVDASYVRQAHPPGPPMLEASQLSVKGKLHGISLTLRAGEITGMAGLIGAGRTELCRALFGIDRLSGGSIRVAGETVRLTSPRDAVGAGIALVTEDRQVTGLALPLSIAINATLANTEAISHFGFLNRARQNRVATDYIQKLRIKAQGPRQPAGRLSGGNQQKVVIAKWLFREPRVFLFDEPTRGIDVGAKKEVFDLIHELAGRGAAVLMVSSEIPELLQVADRILVMCQGRLAGELPGGTTAEEILSLAMAKNGARETAA